MRKTWFHSVIFTVILLVIGVQSLSAQNKLDNPTIEAFLGTSGFGNPHDQAPKEIEQFGQLAGMWQVKQEMLGQDGEWQPAPPAVWVWRYTLGGFVVQDLWFQAVDELPAYLADLGRDYLLSSTRVFDPHQGHWNVAWVANGGGTAPGQDFGTFIGLFDNGEITMSAPAIKGVGLQRVVFSYIEQNSFRWRSDYSRDDGKTWTTVMRMVATRME